MSPVKNTFVAVVALLAATAFADPVPAGLESLTTLTSFSERRGLEARASRVTGGCGTGEVAVGIWKVCSPSPGGICNTGGCVGTDGGCQAELGAVWEGNCGGAELTSTIMTESYCKGGWNGGSVFGGEVGVRCGAGDAVEAVTIKAFDGTADAWKYCYQPKDASCEWTVGIATKYANIDWCCKPGV